jgi:hypothetical protein
VLDGAHSAMAVEGSPAGRLEAIVRRYLMVANQTLGTEEFMQAVRERMASGPAEFHVVAPATPVAELVGRSLPLPPMPVMGGVLTLPAPPEEARRLAQAKLDAALEQMREAGATADGEVCVPSPLHAVEAVLKDQKFDEIIVVTLPARLSRWLHQDLPARLKHRFDIPVTHVTAAST